MKLSPSAGFPLFFFFSFRVVIRGEVFKDILCLNQIKWGVFYSHQVTRSQLVVTNVAIAS